MNTITIYCIFVQKGRNNMNERYDIAIIGSGVAGVSAAINARIRNKNLIIFGNKDLSNKLVKASKINNYLGFSNISGIELKNHFEQHLSDMDITIQEEKVTTIVPMGDYFSILSKAGTEDKMYEASSIILAMGVNFGKPLPGEDTYLGKGVGYCATCDAPLYKGKTVAIVAYSKKDEEEAEYVASLAEKVYYVPMYKDEVQVPDNITIIKDTPVAIKGNEFVEVLELKNQSFKTDGIFLLRDSTPPGQLLVGLEMDGNHIKVDRAMTTNFSGCFAAGDIVGTPYQYIKAAGEGNIAALSAVSYLSNK